MRPPRIGVFLRDDRLTVVALTGRDRLTYVVVDAAEDPAGTLAGELHSRGLGGGRLRVGLDRRLAVVKAIELPTSSDMCRSRPSRPASTGSSCRGGRRSRGARWWWRRRPTRWSDSSRWWPAPSVTPPR